MNPIPIIEAFALVARPEILRDHLPNSCIASTWITIEVMHHFGLHADPLGVRVRIYNPVFVGKERELGIRPTPTQAAEWTRKYGSWAVGLGFESPHSSAGIGGHLATLVNQRVLVDASIDQATDTEHSIVLPPVLWTPVNARFLAGEERHRCLIDRVAVEYERHMPTRHYTDSYDWGHNPETDGAVQRILQKMALHGVQLPPTAPSA